MIKMFINDEEVVSNKELIIKEEMLATPSAILNNCYPKSWEDIKDYTSKFYYPKDYSRCIIGRGEFKYETNRYAKLTASGTNPTFETNTEKPFDEISIDGRCTQETSTDPVMPSPDYPSEVECVKGINLWDERWENGYYNRTTGEKGAGSNYIRSKDYIPIIPNTDIYFNKPSDFVNYAVLFYDEEFLKIGDVAPTNTASKTFKSPATASYFTFYGDTDVSNATYQNNIIITKGTVASEYLPYGTIQIKDVGKNLFDNTSNIVQNKYIGDDGTIQSENKQWYQEDYIKVANSTNYIMSSNSNNIVRIALYDEDKNFISRVYSYGKIQVLTTSLTKYVRLSGYNNINDNIQLEQGTVATSYEPYQENITNIDLQGNELCSLPNNVKDELVIENGRVKIINRVRKIILNGSEEWYQDRELTNSYRYYTTGLTPTNVVVGMSNYFKFTTVNAVNTIDEEAISIANNRQPIIRINKSIATTVNDFKTWLSEHNTTVYYELATPTEIDLGEVEEINTFEGVNNVSLIATLDTNMDITYLWENYGLLFCGIVKNSGNISLNPRYPHFGSFQILDFKTFLSESDTLDFVISNKTISEAIEMVVDKISLYGFTLGNIKIFGADDVIGAYSTQNKTAYDVFQYFADITGSRWFTRLVDEKTVAIDFYDPTLMPRGINLEYNEQFFENNKICDLTFSYGSRDYRNKQVILSDEIYASIDYTEIILSNGYQTTFNTDSNIGIVKSIIIDNEEKTFATNSEKETGITAEFYYTPGKNTFESDGLSYLAGTQITITYTPLVKGRQVVYNNDEVTRIYSQTGRKGVIARYESRNDILSSDELDRVAQTYIRYKGSPEVILTLTIEDIDLYDIGQVVYFDSPIPDLAQDYMIKSKQTRIIMLDDINKKIFFVYELTSSFNAEKEINYFDNQRNKNKGNISTGETITRNIDIENSVNIIFKEMTIKEISATGNNILDSILESPFLE